MKPRLERLKKWFFHGFEIHLMNADGCKVRTIYSFFGGLFIRRVERIEPCKRRIV
jgi:hypothetical protein